MADKEHEIPVKVVDRRWWAQAEAGTTTEPGSASSRKPTYVEELEQKLAAVRDDLVSLQGRWETERNAVSALMEARKALLSAPAEADKAPLKAAVDERFLDARHAEMWTVVSRPEDVLPAIESAATWGANSRDFAVVR